MKDMRSGAILKIPIAHGEGRYFAKENILDELESNEQVIYKYCDEAGNITSGSNHNGAIRNIAGVTNTQRNVFGMMPHPERACSEMLGNTDGRVILQSFISGASGITGNIPVAMASGQF